MAKLGFEINRKSLSAALASVLGALAVTTAAAQDQAPAADGPAPEVIAKGNIIKQIGKLGPAVLVYSDRSVKFEGGRKVPAGDYAFIGRQFDKEALFNAGLGTDTISKAQNQLSGPSTIEVGTGGGIVSIKSDPDMARFAALAKPPSRAKSVATIVKHHGPKAGKPVVAKAKPQIRAEAPKTEKAVFPVTPVVGAVAANFAPAPFAWEPIKPATYDFNALSASAPVTAAPIMTKETSVSAPVAQDAWSEWRQNVKDRVAQLGGLIKGTVGLIGTLGIMAAFTSGRKPEEDSPAETLDGVELLGEGEDTDSMAKGREPASLKDIAKAFERPDVAGWVPVTEEVDAGDNGDVSEGVGLLADLGVQGDLGIETPAQVVAAFRGDPRDYILSPTGDGTQPAVTPQAPATAVPVVAKDTGYNGAANWPEITIPNLVEVAPLTAVITNACNKVGVPASGIGTEFVPVESHDKGRHAEISPRVGGFSCDLSKGRFKLTVLSNEDGTLSIRASGEGLGRGKAPVEATLGADGKLAIDQETLAARMSAKQTKGNGIDAEFAKAAFETFGTKAETVIMRALNRAVAVIQAAPEVPAAIVRYDHRTPAMVRSARTLAPQT